MNGNFIHLPMMELVVELQLEFTRRGVPREAGGSGKAFTFTQIVVKRTDSAARAHSQELL